MLKYSFVDLYPYIFMITFFIMILRFNINKKKKENIIFYTLLLFNILRYDVGWDYSTYIEEINMGVNELIYSRYEPLSKFIFIISALLDFYPLTFIVFGCLHFYLFRKVINELADDKQLALIFYFLFPMFFLGDLSTIRQAVATQFVFASFLFLKKNQLKQYFLFIIIAVCFQKSALFGLLYLLLYKKILPNYVNWTLFIASFFLGEITKTFVSHNIFIDGFQYYFTSEETKATSTLNYYYYAINIFILLNYNRFVNINKENAIYIQIANIGIFLFNIFLFEPITSTRSALFFLYFWVLLFSTLPKFKRIYSNRIIIILPFAIVFFIFLYLYVNSYNNGYLSKVSFIPYRLWLFNL